jgi:phospholipid/cholesterol/gamma-HCH transport system substrate-binding protein
MKNKNQIAVSIKVGFFVIIGLATFLFSIYIIGKQQRLFGTSFPISAHFYDVSGLQVGNNVRFSGITVGVVNDIQIISDSLVRVGMLIEEDVRRFIKKDARAVIGSEGLMGNKVINILPGSADLPPIEKNDLIATEPSIDIDNIVRSVQHTLYNIEFISDDLAEITASIAAGRGLAGTLLMDTAFAKQLEQTLGHVRQGARGFEENMEAVQDNILLRGYFRRQERQEEREKRQQEREQAREQRIKEREEARESGERRGLFGLGRRRDSN